MNYEKMSHTDIATLIKRLSNENLRKEMELEVFFRENNLTAIEFYLEENNRNFPESIINTIKKRLIIEEPTEQEFALLGMLKNSNVWEIIVNKLLVKNFTFNCIKNKKTLIKCHELFPELITSLIYNEEFLLAIPSQCVPLFFTLNIIDVNEKKMHTTIKNKHPFEIINYVLENKLIELEFKEEQKLYVNIINTYPIDKLNKHFKNMYEQTTSLEEIWLVLSKKYNETLTELVYSQKIIKDLKKEKLDHLLNEFTLDSKSCENLLRAFLTPSYLAKESEKFSIVIESLLKNKERAELTKHVLQTMKVNPSQVLNKTALDKMILKYQLEDEFTNNEHRAVTKRLKI